MSIHAFLTEILACFLPGRAKDLSAPLYIVIFVTKATTFGAKSGYFLSYLMSIHATSYRIVELIATTRVWNYSGRDACLGKTPHFMCFKRLALGGSQTRILFFDCLCE